MGDVAGIGDDVDVVVKYVVKAIFMTWMRL